LIELLRAWVERPEADVSRDSANSSKPPSGDTQERRAQRAEAKPKGASRRRGKQTGDEGHRLSPGDDPDARVRRRPRLPMITDRDFQ
jgi:transposase